MSLNGLDDPAVIDAYQTALTEAGGWLLLKYASRDEVTLLGRGTGGVPDVRVAVEGYEEKSPLYGFLQYRRRKVVLKYVPDGVSRLVQARTTVQFQSILDKFSPQDTTFEFKEATDLSESALSSACLLHAASGSMTSSSSSLRRRRLMEIAEDAEEGAPPVRAELESPLSEDSSKRLSQASDATAVPPPPTPGGDDSVLAESPIVADDEADAQAETKSVHSVSRKRFLDQLAQQPFEHRSSTQSMRPSLQELGYSTSSKQKVKLGPRPSVDMNGRPRTAGSMSRHQDQRPVAALPPGVRPRKPPSGPGRPKSQHDAVPVPTLASLKNAPPMPLLIPPPSISVPRPKLSPGAKSMNALVSSGMSPEKQRLMKALELRKKQMEKRTKELQKKEEKRKSATPEIPPTDVPGNKENIDHAQTKPQPPEEPQQPAVEATKVEPAKQASAVTTEVIEEKKPTTADLAKADSAVAMAAAAREDTAEDIAEDNILEETTSKYTAPEDTPQQDTAPEDNKPEDNKPEDNKPEDTKSEDTARKDIALGDTPRQNMRETAPEDNKPEDTSSKDTVKEETAEDNASEDAAPKDSESAVQAPAEPPVATPQTQDEAVEPHPEQTPEPASQTLGEENTTDDSTVAEQFSDRVDDEKVTTASTPEPETALEDTTKPDEEQSIQYEDDDSTPTASEAIHSVATSTVGSQDAVVAGAPEADETAPKEVPTSTSTNTASQVVLADSTAPLSLSRGEENNHRLSQQKIKRIALLDPIQVPTPDLSDEDNLLSDDSFMEELKSATFQEAKPVSVGKGPLSPDGEPRTPLEAWQTRAVSNPGRRPSDLNVMPVVGRSISATFAGGDEQAGPAVVTAKKVNVSSGISKRIKALEMFSSTREGVSSPTLTVPPTNGLPSPTVTAFETFRKRASVSMSGGLPSSATPSRRSSFIGPSPDAANPPSLSRKESQSVSVTARILRDSSTPPTDVNADPMQSNVLNLHRSPLIVEHNSPEEADRKSNGVPERRPTLSSRGLSRSSTDTTTGRSESRASSRSRLDDISSEEKRDSHKLPPSHTEEETQHAAPKAVDIGEVNVQFPDTLLWKRRFLRIDHQGYLILTPGNADAGSRNIVKRYHLSEFQTPCLPDEDRQELPNSILLDFRNGSTLQCACESRKGQAAALQTLVDAHNAYRH